MLKKLISIILVSALALSLTACKEEVAQESHIVDKDKNVSSAASGGSTESTAPRPTFLPTATQAPDAAAKADEKISSGGDANATVVNEDGTTRDVNLEFQIVNSTGIDFIQMFIEPVTTDISQIANGTKRFTDGFVFENGMAIQLTPPTEGTGDTAFTLGTTLFNIAAIDANGTGYVFQNIDLAASNSIVLMLENGVPKAVIN